MAINVVHFCCRKIAGSLKNISVSSTGQRHFEKAEKEADVGRDLSTSFTTLRSSGLTKKLETLVSIVWCTLRDVC